jgi:hypothetical protein
LTASVREALEEALKIRRVRTCNAVHDSHLHEVLTGFDMAAEAAMNAVIALSSPPEPTPAELVPHPTLCGVMMAPPEPTGRSSGEGAVPHVSIQSMGLSGGRTDYFVQIKVGERAVTPHVFREEYKAAYHVALYDWLLNGVGEEPNCVEFRPEDWPARVVTAPQAPEPTRERYDCDPAAALDVSSCGQENDYLRARPAKAEPTREEIANTVQAASKTCLSWEDAVGIAQAILALTKPRSEARAPTHCPNGIEHGACLHPDCVSSCPGRLPVRSEARDEQGEGNRSGELYDCDPAAMLAVPSTGKSAIAAG